MKSKIAITTAALAGASLLLGAPALWAIDANTYPNQPVSGLNAPPSETATDPTAFLQAANTINCAEVKMGELVQEHSQSEAVRKLGRHMIRDHKALEEKVKSVALKKNIQLATQLDPKHQNMVDQLSALSGAAFDQQYVADMVAGHRKAILLFRQAAGSNSDPDLREFATDTIPQLQHHLQMAQEDSTIVNEPAGAEPKP
jgi:putative membrane protein